MTPTRIRRGLYDLGLTHAGSDYPGAPACGGRVLARRHDDDHADFRWECYCEACGSCDPNGWPTLRDCVREAPGYWAADVAVPLGPGGEG